MRNVTNLANLPPSERPKAKPSRKIVNNQQNNNAGGNSNNVVTDKSKKCQLQAALQQHSQQLAQLQQVKIRWNFFLKSLDSIRLNINKLVTSLVTLVTKLEFL